MDRYETHRETIRRLIRNMLEAMPEYRVRTTIEAILAEEIEAHRKK